MMNISPLYKIIALSTVLAAGFILIILSCALFNNWIPLTVVGLFLLAPIPNGICGRFQAQDDFMSESSRYVNNSKEIQNFFFFWFLRITFMLIRLFLCFI